MKTRITKLQTIENVLRDVKVIEALQRFMQMYTMSHAILFTRAYPTQLSGALGISIRPHYRGRCPCKSNS